MVARAEDLTDLDDETALIAAMDSYAEQAYGSDNDGGQLATDRDWETIPRLS